MGGVFNPVTISIFSYAGNNPIKYKDPDGKDIAFAVDPMGAGGRGHTSLYFQDVKGNWYKYDQGAAGATSSGAGSSGSFGFLSGSDAPAGVSIVPAKGPIDGAVTIKTTKEQDALIVQSAVKSREEHNSGKTKYNLYCNNCTDAAVDVVNNSGAGIEVPNPWHDVKPNTWFKDLKEWAKPTPNSGGLVSAPTPASEF